MGTWNFADSPETPALTLRGVLGGQPILFVERDENGGWHFLDGRALIPGGELVLAPVKRLVDGDVSLNQLADLPPGWRAFRRTPDQPWRRESSATKDVTRAQTAALLAEMREASKAAPPGSPTTTELLREDRER